MHYKQLTDHLFVGVAAFNIGASTLHYALKLPVEDGHGSTVTSSYNVLQGEALEDLRRMWQGVRYLIIDEISMVSAQQLQYIDMRLKEITGQQRLPFGGLSVITVGDFYQLPPVTKSKKTPFIFYRQPGLWRSLFKSQYDCSNYTCMQLHVTHDFTSCMTLPSACCFTFLGALASATNDALVPPRNHMHGVSGVPV